MTRLTGIRRGAGVVGAAVALVATALSTTAQGSAPPDVPSWTMGGHDLSNTRSNPFEHLLSPTEVHRLAVRWHLTTHGDVSATPAVAGGAVYVPDWGGWFSKLDAATGRVLWSHQVSEYDGTPGAVSRTSPVVHGDRVYIGDLNGGNLIALDTATGARIWSTRIDPHPGARLTQSPVLYDGVLYQGVASSEEQLAGDPAYPCCTFRGSMNAVDAATGHVLWRTFTVPDNHGQAGGYSGGAIWGSTPAVDPARGSLYVTTGNNYQVPQSVTDCQSAGKPASECLDPADRIDSVMALDLRTGAVRWTTGGREFDSFNVGCFTGPPPNNCPTHLGQDADFAQGAQLFTVTGADGRRHELVGAGQKSGQYWALDPDTGRVVWSAAVFPGSANGGMMFGSATDGRRIYVAGVDAARIPYTLPDGRTITYGSVAALDPATGKVLWQVADPEGGFDEGALTTADGVVYGASLSGHLLALDGATGRVLWDHAAPGASVCGPAVVNGTVYWGDGYHNYLGGPTHAHDLYAFSLDGR